MRSFLAMVSDRAAWLLPIASLLTLAGYFGPWVDHRVAGLVVTGLDLGEYVKFLPVIRNGQILLWREGFYLPLVTVSLACSLAAFRDEFGYRWPMRAGLLLLATVAALNMLPPAWTPGRMVSVEFQQQSAAIVVCLGAVAFSPFLALLPERAVAGLVAILAMMAILIPVRNFMRVLPDISQLYNQPLQPGWGVYLLLAGLAALLLVQIGLFVQKPTTEEIQ